MEQEREQQYEELRSVIGNTPLVLYTGEVPNNNQIWIKEECKNPFGSHYDRVYLALFSHYEASGRLSPGRKILETSSGTAGASCAAVARRLGYPCHLAIPEGVDEAVIQKIREEGATIDFTPELEYIRGFPEYVRTYVPEHIEVLFLNHSMGRKHGHAYANNEIVLGALEEITREVLKQMPFDYYLPAVGNGSSVLGPGRILPATTQIIAFESSQSAVAYDQKYPEKYFEQFGIKPGVLPKHKLRGTSFQGIDFPHIIHAVEQGLINDVILLSDTEVSQNYFKHTGRHDFEQLPHWDIQLDEQAMQYGRSTRAGVVAALELAKNVRNKKLVIIAYDYANRYDK